MKLELEGLSCASCAARIERSLNKLNGVEATVNFATERATVHCDEDVRTEQLIAAVEGAGYGAHVARPTYEGHAAQVEHGMGGHHHEEEPLAVLTRRLLVAVALTLPVARQACLAGTDDGYVDGRRRTDLHLRRRGFGHAQRLPRELRAKHSDRISAAQRDSLRRLELASAS